MLDDRVQRTFLQFLQNAESTVYSEILMKWLVNTLTTSIGRKLVVSITGLFLVTFLIAHLAGNFTLFLPEVAGQEHAFDTYAHFMATNPIIKILEIVMFAGFIIHIVQAIMVSRQNRKARPDRYVKNSASENSSFLARNMIYTGSIVLVFLIIHLKSFFYERITRMPVEPDFSLYQIVITTFADPLYVSFYVFAMIILALHLHHGFQSGFQTLGLTHKKYTPLIKTLGVILAILIPLGFAIIPVYIGFIK